MTEEEVQAACRSLAPGDWAHATFADGEVELVQVEVVPTKAGERLCFVRVHPDTLAPMEPMLGLDPSCFQSITKAPRTQPDAWQVAGARLCEPLWGEPEALEAMLALIRTCRADASLSRRPLVSHAWLRVELAEVPRALRDLAVRARSILPRA